MWKGGYMEDIGLKLKRLHDEMHKQANNRLQKKGMTFSQLHVLIYLYRDAEDKTAPLKQLEKRFEVAQATMAGIVSRLENKGLVCSFSDENDKRIKKVMITDTGEELLLENREEILRHNQRLMDGFTEEEKNCLSGYLDRLYENVKKESEETGE